MKRLRTKRAYKERGVAQAMGLSQVLTLSRRDHPRGAPPTPGETMQPSRAVNNVCGQYSNHNLGYRNSHAVGFFSLVTPHWATASRPLPLAIEPGERPASIYYIFICRITSCVCLIPRLFGIISPSWWDDLRLKMHHDQLACVRLAADGWPCADADWPYDPSTVPCARGFSRCQKHQFCQERPTGPAG